MIATSETDSQILRILAWNIRHGGGRRIGKILDRIAAHAPDIAVISEYRCDEAGSALVAGLANLGLGECRFLPAPPRSNGVLIASRMAASEAGSLAPQLDKPHALLTAEVAGIDLTGVYMPVGDAKTPYWEALVAAAPDRRGGEALFVGDFNTGRHYEDESGATLISAPFMDRMETLGFTDVWRRRNPDAREFTWISNHGNGFRFDHAFASAALAERIVDVRYVHDDRAQGLSDHSALILDIRRR